MVSDSTGLTIVKQSRSVKTCLIMRRILFFCSTLSEAPFCCLNAFSMYCLEVIWNPFSSISLRVKSRTTQRKDGKYFEISSGSEFSSSSDFICSYLERFTISERLLRAFSSIVPMLLKMKKELRRRASRKIFVS